MSYSGMAAAYADEPTRTRTTACARQQAFGMTTAEGSGAVLAQHVIAGDSGDIDAIIAAVCTGPNWAELADDGALLSAVQAVWPTVAAARYPAG